MATTSTTRPATKTAGYFRLLWRALGIRPNELALGGHVAVLFLVVQSNHAVGANTADALFFLRFGVDRLPTMILLSGIVVMAGIVVYAAGLGLAGPSRWLAPVLLVFAGWLVAEWVAIRVDLAGIYPVVWLSSQLVIWTTFTLMWNVAEEVATTRQAKRLYPLFASAGIAGGVAGNALTGPLAVALGTENLLIVQAGLLVVAALMTVRIARRFFTSETETTTRPSAIRDLAEGLALTRRTPLLQLGAATATAMSLLFFLVVFPFSERVAASFDTESAVAGFLGVFSAAATALTFVVSLFLANRLFAWIGIVATLLIVPIVYLAGFALWLAMFTLGTAVIVRGAQWIAVNALGFTAWASLFNVVEGRRRGQVLAFMAAIPTQLGTVLAGVALLVGTSVSNEVLFGIGLVAAGAMLAIVLRMRRAYVDALVAAVRRGAAGVFDAPHLGFQRSGDHAETLAVLRQELADDRETARLVALRHLVRIPGRPAQQLVESALADPVPRVRGAALRALAERSDDGATTHAEAAVTDLDPLVRREAIELLRRAGGAATEKLRGALDDLDPVVRAQAAGLVGGTEGVEVLRRMLHDSDPSVIVAALSAGGGEAFPDTELVPLATHEHPGVRAAVAAAWGAAPARVEALTALLEDPVLSVRSAAARSLATTDEGAAVLFVCLGDTHFDVVDCALGALVADDRRRDDVHAWAADQARRARGLRTLRMSLRSDDGLPARSYLSHLLELRQVRHERWALEAMTEGAATAELATATAAVWSDDPEVEEQALEAIDAMGDRSITRALLPLFEESDDDAAPGEDDRAALKTLTVDPDPWIRAIAVCTVAEQLTADLAEVGRIASADDSELVRAALPQWELTAMESVGTLDTVERVMALAQVPMFSDLDPEDLERVAEIASECRYEPGDVVYREGEAGHEMLVIVSGGVQVGTVTDTGIDVLRTLGPGEHVGELALLRRKPRSADVIAGDEGVHGLTITGPELQTILQERPHAAMAMLATLAERLGSGEPPHGDHAE